MQVSNKPLPPFGTVLRQLLKIIPALDCSPYVFVGKDAWREANAMARRGQLCLCLPPDHAPEAYDWPVKGLSLIIFDTGNMTELDLDKIAFCLLKAGARQIVIYSENASISIINQKGF